MTPHLVSLARRLEGRPFHLIASHCQHKTRQDVVDYVKSKGLSADTPNLSVTSFGRHPKVRGNGHVPYYMVFDHHGDLARQHMGGAYHGGDGLGMVKWVDKLLKDIPPIYLGKAPFQAVPELAARVANKKQLPAAVLEITKRLAGDATDAEKAELQRLDAAVRRYRDRELSAVTALHVSDPSAVVTTLQQLLKELRGTTFATTVEAELKKQRASKDLSESIKVFKVYRKAMARLARTKRPTAKLRSQTAKRLEKALAGREQLPIAARIQRTIRELR